jgi:ABC-type branched-subunit amino acid transport system substrate-binding protein
MHTHHRPQRLVRVALFTALVLIGAACGNDNKKNSTSDTTGGSGKAPAAAPGFDGTTIKVGVVTPQTGPVKVIGDPLTNGNKVFFDALNAKGGVAGKYKVQMVTVDSKYDATTGVQQYNAIKNDVVMFAQLLGTPIVNAVLPQLKRDNIVAQPASLDAFWVREQNLLPFGGPYQIQAINALDWYLGEGGGKGKKLCSAIHDDPYGEAGEQGVDFAAKELGFTLAATAKFKSTDTDFTAPVQQLQAAGCQAVFLVATPSTAGGIMGKSATVGFAPQWIGQSPTYIGAFLKSPALPYFQKNYLIASEGTEWGDTTVDGMKKMVADQQQFAPTQAPDPYFVFGYGEAWATTQLLEKAVARGDLSRGGVITAMNSLDKLSFDGLFGDYPYGRPGDRNPPRVTTIFKVDPAAPGGLRVVKRGIESSAAKKYKFPTA